MYLVQTIGDNDISVQLWQYRKHKADFLWEVRVYRGKRRVALWSFYAFPDSANEEAHIALASAREGCFK